MATMINKEYQSVSDYIILSAYITNSDISLPVTIHNNIVQLELFETVDKPFLTGNLVIVDDNRIYDTIGFNGTEIITIVLKQPSSEGTEITNEFVIERVQDAVKTNDQTETVVLKLIDKIAYDNSLSKFSKAYTDTPDKIIKKIIKDHLNIDIEMPEIKPIQSEMRVVIPYMTPFDACDWIRDRMSTTNGFPYFFFKCVNENVIKLKSLEEMLLEDSWNSDMTDFRYSQIFGQTGSTQTDIRQTFNISSYSQTGSEHMLKYITGGQVGSDFSIHDIVSGRTEKFHFDINDVIDMLTKTGIISRDQVSNFKLDYSFNDKSINQHSSQIVTRMIMNQTYNNDTNNYYSEGNVAKLRLDTVNRIIHSMMFKNAIDIDLNGVHFLTGRNKSIGRNINVTYYNNDPSIGDKKMASEDELKDYKRSGKYMIYSAKHSFYDTSHIVSATGVKLANDKRAI